MRSIAILIVSSIGVLPCRLVAQTHVHEHRAHLRSIARSFSAGDFTAPFTVHDDTVPGVPVRGRRGASTLTGGSGGMIAVLAAAPGRR